MKIKTINLIIALAVTAISFANANDSKTEKFEVKGNCGMCESKIEKAAKSVPGVATADWDKSTKIITVTFDDQKTEIDKVHKAIAKVGYDTDKVKAKDVAYKALPGCCQYDRE